MAWAAQEPRGPPRAPAVFAYLAALLIFAGHLALGADQTSLALVFCAAWFAFLAVLLASQAWARAAIEGTALLPAALPFCLVLLLAILSLTPLGVGGPHPIWRFVPAGRAVVSIAPYATLIEIVKLLGLASAFLFGAALGARDDGPGRTVRAVLIVGTIYCAWAFLDHAANPDRLFGAPRPFDPSRLSAAFGSANTAATLFGALVLLGMADLVRTYARIRPAGLFHASHVQRLGPALTRPLLALALSITCLVLTQSRAGLAATAAAAVVLMGALGLARSRRAAMSGPMIGAGVLAVALLLASVAINFGHLQHRLTFLPSDTVARGRIYAAHWQAFLAEPWSGYGLGTFQDINGMAMNLGDLSALETIGAAHNVYIQWLEEGGVLGAAAMFATIGAIGVQLAINIARRRRGRPWLLAIAAVLLLFLVHGAADYALQTPSMALFLSFLLGVGVASESQPRRMVKEA